MRSSRRCHAPALALLATGLVGCHWVAPYEGSVFDAASAADASTPDQTSDLSTGQTVLRTTSPALDPLLQLPQGGAIDQLCGVLWFADAMGIIWDGDSSNVPCTTITAEDPGYYSIYAESLADSCGEQPDESGYLLVANDSNPSGLPRESVDGHPYLVLDADNTPCDQTAPRCPLGTTCVQRAGSTCCAPELPVFLGTFWLDATNRLCLHYICGYEQPDYIAPFISPGGCDLPLATSTSIKLSLDIIADGRGSNAVAACGER